MKTHRYAHLFTLSLVLSLSACDREHSAMGHRWANGDDSESITLYNTASKHKEDQGRPHYNLHLVRGPGVIWDEEGTYSLGENKIHFFPDVTKKPQAREHIQDYKRDEAAHTLTFDFYDWEDHKTLADEGSSNQ